MAKYIDKRNVIMQNFGNKFTNKSSGQISERYQRYLFQNLINRLDIDVLGNSVWTRSFYRFVDTYEGENCQEVREIEKQVFQQVKL